MKNTCPSVETLDPTLYGRYLGYPLFIDSSLNGRALGYPSIFRFSLAYTIQRTYNGREHMWAFLGVAQRLE